RFSSSVMRCSAGNASEADARDASSFSRSDLSLVWMSMSTPDGDRKSWMVIVILECDARARVGTPVGWARVLFRCAQPVSDARFSEDKLRSFGVSLDLAAQLPHIHTQVLRVRRLVPKLVEQELVGQHLACMLNQQAKKIVLLR